MNKIYYLVIAVAALVSFVSCNNDTDLDHKSIFPDGVDKTTQNEFDLWVDAYNELMGRDFFASIFSSYDSADRFGRVQGRQF